MAIGLSQPNPLTYAYRPINGESVRILLLFGRAGYSYGLGVRVHIDSKASQQESFG